MPASDPEPAHQDTPSTIDAEYNTGRAKSDHSEEYSPVHRGNGSLVKTNTGDTGSIQAKGPPGLSSNKKLSTPQ